MRDFFHADCTIYKKRLKRTIITVLIPLAAVCVFCSCNIIFNLRSGGDRSMAQIMLYVILIGVALGIITCFSGAYIADKKTRRHTRFTYFDILPKCMIFSRYAGEHHIYGERTIYRRLYYIPFSGLTEIRRDPKASPHDITLIGEIREYLLPSDDLGYHINEDGELLFDHAELNERFFEQRTTLQISEDFGSTKHLEAAVRFFWEQFRSIPEKKPFNIADYVMQKTKKPMRTSNRLLDAPSFDRKW